VIIEEDIPVIDDEPEPEFRLPKIRIKRFPKFPRFPEPQEQERNPCESGECG
jgi:hypothetical protein